MRHLPLLVVFVAVISNAQTFISQPATPSLLPAQRPLSTAGREFLRARLERYRLTRVAEALDRSTVMSRGLSDEADAVERSRQEGSRWVAPHHIGIAVSGAPPAIAVDPAVEEAARGRALRAKGRVPTAAEVNAEIAAFDASIAALNQQLAAQRPVIAATMKQTGRFPRALEAPLLHLAPADPEALTLSPLSRRKLENALTTFINELAASAAVVTPTAPIGPLVP